MALPSDEFDDEDFNDLLGDDLDALEQQAFQSTQAPGRATNQHGHYTAQPEVGLGGAQFSHSQTANQYAEYDDGEDEVIDTIQNGYGQLATQVAATTLQVAEPQHALRAHHDVFQQPDLARFESEVPARATKILPHRPSSQTSQTIVQEPIWKDENHVQDKGLPTNSTVGELQAQVQALLLEKEKLQLAVQDANKQVLTKTGEIAIVRSNHDRSLREKDQKLFDLQREIASANERHESELDQARKQHAQLTTESQFADHDKLLDRTRKRTQATKLSRDIVVSRPDSTSAGAVTTPHKNRENVSKHGFDAEERSPVRILAGKSGQLTPRAAKKKRKRPPESPVKPLPMSQNDEINLPDDSIRNSFALTDLGVGGGKLKAPITDDRFVVLQRFINHRLTWGGKRTIEVLAAYHFPSDAESSLATILLDELAKLQSKADPENLPVALCAMVIAIWTRCTTEKYYEPLVYLTDLITFILSNFPTAVPLVMDDLVPLAQKTADVNIVPRFKRFRRPAAGQSNTTAPTENEHIDTQACLQVLFLVITSCHRDPDQSTRFWTLVRFDFISMLLRSSQSIDDIYTTSQLLRYSVRPNTFGCIIDSSHKARPGGVSDQQPAFDQARSEDHIIDRVTSMLIEVPRPLDEDDPYSDADVAEMRLELLSVIQKFCEKPHSAHAFARHTLGIGRLVRCMNEEFHASMNRNPGWEARVEVVCMATRLLYHFIHAHSEIVNINEKLRAVPGGAHKYLVVLTRLAFWDGSVYGQVVDADVVDCAHQLLEDHVNPEEGEALMAAFQSGHPR